ncbi:MAG: hypothetical protein ACP5OP_07775 [Leptospirillia bacterium]
MPTTLHLLVGTGGEVGEALSRRLSGPCETVFATSHRHPLPALTHAKALFWDLASPPDNSRPALHEIDQALTSGNLKSLSLFAHPSFSRTDSPPDNALEILPFLSRITGLIEHLRPRLTSGGVLLVFFPSFSHHRAAGYLAARAWVGALEGIFNEWSRNTTGAVVTGLEMVVTPDRHRPHLTPDMEARIASRTTRGRLASAEEIADFAAWLIRSGSPLFHGQILKTEGGPYY